MSVGLSDDRIPAEIAAHCRRTLADAGAELTYREYDHRPTASTVTACMTWLPGGGREQVSQ